jgi:short-subunit dehydrogenase
MLVNNVARMDQGRGKLHQLRDDELLQTVNVNTCPAIYMTRILGAEMRKKEHSAIINMSSYYSAYGHFALPIYCAGTAFTSYFTRAVSYENPNMDILTVLGLPVKSDRNPRGVDADELVEGVLHDIGKVRVSYGHWKHSLYRMYYIPLQCSRLMGDRGSRGKADRL